MKRKNNKVIIFDTTLRDGEQSPGASLNHREKLEIARQLAILKVDIIEAGFPVASPGDFDAVNAIAGNIHGPCIAALARTVEKDIERAGQALAPAPKRRIHTFSSGSDIHLKNILRTTREQNIERSVAAIRYARTFTDDVEYSAQDTTRSDRDYLVDLYTAAAEAGASTLNIPDTVGYALPDEYAGLISYLVERIRVPGVVFSVHCHDDLGMAVANSLAGVKAGARQVECAINGLGERAGNTPLEEIVMAIKTRSDMFGGLATGIRTDKIFPASRLVSRLTGMNVQRNKAIVGANAFAHESGVHQDGVLKERSTYEIMRPSDIGMSDSSELVLGKHSGRHAFQHGLARLGIHLEPGEVQQTYERFKELADKKKHIYDDDLMMLVHEEMRDHSHVFMLDYLHVSTGTDTVPTATVRLRRGRETLQDAACGDGPVDATFRTIDRLTGVQGKLVEFSLQAVTIGKDAMGEVSVRVLFDDETMTAKAASTDIVEASAKAYLSCINRMLYIRNTATSKGKASGKGKRITESPL